MGGWSEIGAHAFVGYSRARVSRSFRARETAQWPPVAVRSRNNNNNEDFDFDFLVRRVKRADKILLRRFERADKIEIRNDAVLAASYVLGRFLAYDVALSVARITPGWDVQDLVWLTETFSSATVLVVFYVVAGLMSRMYERNTLFAPPPATKALVNVALCCPAWLLTEHLLGYGPADIAGDTFGGAVATGLLGLGSFMAVAKTLSSGMR